MANPWEPTSPFFSLLSVWIVISKGKIVDGIPVTGTVGKV